MVELVTRKNGFRYAKLPVRRSRLAIGGIPDLKVEESPSMRTDLALRGNRWRGATGGRAPELGRLAAPRRFCLFLSPPRQHSRVNGCSTDHIALRRR